MGSSESKLIIPGELKPIDVLSYARYDLYYGEDFELIFKLNNKSHKYDFIQEFINKYRPKIDTFFFTNTYELVIRETERNKNEYNIWIQYEYDDIFMKLPLYKNKSKIDVAYNIVAKILGDNIEPLYNRYHNRKLLNFYDANCLAASKSPDVADLI
jgi:hypothetical protein